MRDGKGQHVVHKTRQLTLFDPPGSVLEAPNPQKNPDHAIIDNDMKRFAR
jgi:hypothetical protein